MKVDVAAPTTTRGRHDWSPLIDLLRRNQPGVSLRIALADLPGTTKAEKQVRLHSAAGRYSLAVRTQTEDEFLFVHRIEKTK